MPATHPCDCGIGGEPHLHTTLVTDASGSITERIVNHVLDTHRCDAGPTADFHDDACPPWCVWGHPDTTAHAPQSARATTIIPAVEVHWVHPSGSMPHALTAITANMSGTSDTSRVTCPVCIEHLRSQP